MKIKCIILDDEHLATILMKDYVAKMPQLELIGVFNHSMEALACMQEQKIDLLFSDIEMPEFSGIDLVKTLPVSPCVIFTTAYGKYAVESFELNVIDYLLKPVSFERFVKAVNKATEFIKLRESKTDHTIKMEHLMVKVDHKLVKIPFDQICYIEGLKEYVSIFTGEQRVVTLESMKHLEEILPADRFMRVHKSYIVAIDKVKALAGNMLEIEKLSIPVGRSFKEKVQKIFKES